VFQKRVLRRIVEPKRDEVIRGCRKLRNEALHNFYSSPSLIRMIKSRGMRRVCTGKKKNAYKTLVGKPEKKRPLGSPRRRWGILLKWILER
jgi:hypothetical protein